MAVHIGKMIKDELERQERTVTWFADKLSCSRANIYNIFERDNIDIVLLVRISRILRRNFLKELAEEMVLPSNKL
ncbi:MAG: XRE family transcriptional regulator [Bacteroides sp.]|nr:XRE family transcriptional regulator [Bacteroides sp.]